MKYQSILVFRALPLVLLALPIGCSKKNDPEPAVATTPEPVRSIHNISTTRCEREERCGNVGAGKTYGSASECVTKLDADGYSDLNSADCKAGLDHAQLDKCLTAIRGEDCGSPADSFERMVDCRSSALCRD